MKKEDLFAKLRANTKEQFDMPDMHIAGIQYADILQQFKDITEAVGGHIIEMAESDDINDAIRKAYPEAKTFASNMKGITLAQKNPDTVAEASDLNGIDVGIVEGSFGVAENGCVWIPQTMKEKSILFISEYLVILLNKSELVNNMHEAYERLQMDERYNFGTFISGPSKTADIEQSLVMGAQAARGVTVILRS